jgi:hypothetical protein
MRPGEFLATLVVGVALVGLEVIFLVAIARAIL